MQTFPMGSAYLESFSARRHPHKNEAMQKQQFPDEFFYTHWLREQLAGDNSTKY